MTPESIEQIEERLLAKIAAENPTVAVDQYSLAKLLVSEVAPELATVSVPDFNRVVDQVRAWLERTYPTQQSLSGGWEITLTDEVGNPWLSVDGRPQMPYERGEFPAEVSFAVVRTTGAIHLVKNGEVQDPELEVAMLLDPP